MVRLHWVRNIFGSSASRRERRRQAAQERRRAKPMLERLEERLNPSPLIEFAANATQLQSDLTNATAHNTQYYIVLTGGNSAYHLASGQELFVGAAASGSSVNIVGLGQKITGNGNRVFAVEPGAVVTLDYLTITGGSVLPTNTNFSFDAGGGIYNSGGNVTLNRVTVKGNLVKGNFAEGGGIYTANGGSLTLQRGSTVESNSAIATPTTGFGGGGFAAGGGLYKSGGSVTLDQATVKNNLAQGVSALGGGIAMFNGGNLTIQGGSTIATNRAVGLAGNGRGAEGGGVLVSSLFSFSPGNLQILDSTV